MDYNENYVKGLLPKRPQVSNKATFGSVLNIAGSGFYTGAAYFSSLSPLKVGCGRSTLASIEVVLRATSALSPDIILMPLESTKEKTISPKSIKVLEKVLDKYKAVSVGCGLSTNKKTGIFFEKLIKAMSEKQTNFVIDADALNLLAKLKNVKLPENSVLTPHPKEMSRLMNVAVDNILLQPEFWVKKCSEKYNCTVVLKMHKTLVYDAKGNFYINTTGNSALAHGGSGDVLCGMITGFLAQGLNSFDACSLAVYLHGLTAEIASEELTEYSTLSSDLLNYISGAIKRIV